MKAILTASAVLAFLMSSVVQVAAYDQTTFEQRVAEITAEYLPQIEALEDRAEALDDDLPSREEIIVNVDLDEWEEVRFSMHIPEFTLDRWEYSMHIPEVTMRLRRFSWDVPEFWVDTTCFLGVCMDLPQTAMRRHEWATEIPEVTMRLRQFSMDIPEITMRHREFSFHLPRIDVGGPRDEVDQVAAAGREIQAEATLLSEAMQSEIARETRAFLNASRTEVVGQFAFALDTISAGIASAPNDDIRNDLIAQRTEIERQRTEVLGQIDAQLAAIG